MSETSAAPKMLTKLEITEEMGKILGNALPSWNPVAVAYVDADGKPQLSFRGTVQRLNDRQLALWARNPEGGMLKALAARPTLSLLFADWAGGDASKRIYLSIVGRGRVESAEEVRQTVYDNSPQLEKNLDAERKGVAIVIDVDEVNGMMPGCFLRMRPE